MTPKINLFVGRKIDQPINKLIVESCTSPVVEVEKHPTSEDVSALINE
jgi:hypothetical protein